MGWREESLECLKKHPVCGYSTKGRLASEPTALTCIALSRRGMANAAFRGARWLAELQTPEGSVGVYEGHPHPRWPTALACLAWKQCAAFAENEFEKNLERALVFLTTLRGKPVDDQEDYLGHDTSLVAWPWVEGTHSWIEPTALSLLAFKSNERLNHPRSREAVNLLRDRLLPDGGCNYGNTRVLDQFLRPHIQPTGLALLALQGEADIDGRIDKSADYLEQELKRVVTASSLTWGLLGLSAHRALPLDAEKWLDASHRRLAARPSPSFHRALFLLADPAWPWSVDLGSDCDCRRTGDSNKANHESREAGKVEATVQ